MARWWTFAGGRINHTIEYALEWLEGWKVIPDNFLVRVEGNGSPTKRSALPSAGCPAPEFWESEETRFAILARIPGYRLSKFQLALPAWAVAEMVGAYLLNFGGARSFLRSDP